MLGAVEQITHGPGIERPNRLKLITKRGMDVVVSLGMLVLFAPLMALIAGIILWKDGGPIIFAHRRIGRNGRPFLCLKFRTMVNDADTRLAEILAEDPDARAEWAEFRKLKNDPRIIPLVGTLLRQTSLDELPQIFNVLRGDMSLVGPRPVVQDELAYYGPHAQDYLRMRPGLTGPWQIGSRSDTSYETRVKQDVGYVNTWSILGDLRIVFRTAMMVMKGRSPGAY